MVFRVATTIYSHKAPISMRIVIREKFLWFLEACDVIAIVYISWRTMKMCIVEFITIYRFHPIFLLLHDVETGYCCCYFLFRQFWILKKLIYYVSAYVSLITGLYSHWEKNIFLYLISYVHACCYLMTMRESETDIAHSRKRGKKACILYIVCAQSSQVLYSSKDESIAGIDMQHCISMWSTFYIRLRICR